ncbi:penicillin-binding protein 2 [Patescibacteria group bacterium]|nr:penicillin-binding protein 2 [Patescibacteria group bacterium]MBU2633106.1 penicillin-binding protein 2 [Patescibacteria group bacterium]
MFAALGSFKFRACFVCAVFFIFGGILIGRLFFIQVLSYDSYSNEANGQYVSFKSKDDIATRGSVYFKEKDGNFISAATLKEGFFVEVNSSLVDNPKDICQKIAAIVELDEEGCVERVQGGGYERVAHRLNSQQAQEIKKINSNSVDSFSEQWRFYPGDFLASQILGFVGYKGDELVGRYGLEQYYEDVLKGKRKNLKEGGSFAALFWDLGKDLLGSGGDKGYDIVLTIEPRVQSVLEGLLGGIIEKWGAEQVGGIIMDPKTGAIIAMASNPNFNPNNYGEVEDISYFKNPLISSVFELGSVFKALTMAAAIDSGKITTETTYFDNGYAFFNGYKIENYDGKGRGTTDMQIVLNESLNTGAIFAMQQIGKEGFYEYVKKYGLGEKTGVDLPNEAVGNLSNLSTMRDLEYATASFGQGIAVSPLEFTVAVSALANGGVIVNPYIVDKIIVEGGKDNITTPSIKRRAIDENSSKIITRMLVNVVDDALLGGTVKLERYSLAAKTGTAQLPKEDGGGYYDDQYLHSFFGYAPAFDAKFIVFLFAKKPQGVKYASQTLTEPFMDVIKFLLSYYEIPPDR